MTIIKSECAVSEVIGMILVLSIAMLVIGSIILVGMPMIESGKHRAKMDIMSNNFLSLQNDIEEVVRGPIWAKDPNEVITISGPLRRTEFQLMDGTFNVMPNNSKLNYSNNSNSFIIRIPSNNVTYISNNDVITYENGAVIRKYENGDALMISDPLINIYNVGDGKNISISIHIITLNSTLSSMAGEGKIWTEIRPQTYSQMIPPYNQTISPTIFPNSNQTIITIYSKYSDAWKNFFDKKLKDAGLKSPNEYNINGKYPLNIIINGTYTNNLLDIFLSVYESRLDIKIR